MRRMENNTTPNSSEETVTFSRRHFYAVLVVLAFATGVLVGYLAWGVTGPTQLAANPQRVTAQDQVPLAEAPVPTTAPTFIRYDIPTEGFPSNGPEDAEIVLVEFSDFQ